jgi:hypothetical protein
MMMRSQSRVGSGTLKKGNKMDENAKRALEAGQAVRAKSAEEFAARTKGKPTPTQEENDRAVLGEHVIDKESDGSESDEDTSRAATRSPERKQLEAKPAPTAGTYQTRRMAPPPPPKPPEESA